MVDTSLVFPRSLAEVDLSRGRAKLPPQTPYQSQIDASTPGLIKIAFHLVGEDDRRGAGISTAKPCLTTIHPKANFTLNPKFPSPPVKGERVQEEKEGIQRKVRN